ncbi:MAG TPA: hypothetical protein VIU40_12425 [Geobacteraceae bacterium]
MKRIVAVVIAAGLALVQVPAFGATTAGSTGKDLCILYSQDCPDQVMSIQQKIARLNGEMAKGTQVYTQDELRHLAYKLHEAKLMLDILTYDRYTMPLY